MSKGKSQLQRLLDLFVYAPAGLAQSAVEEFEALADKGRHRVEGQVHTARLVGQFAVQMARRQAQETFQAAIVRFSGGTGSSVSPPPEQSSGVAERTTTRADWPDDDTRGASTSPATNGSEPANLAIPGYDSLSASQVVQRLGGLSHEELEDVRDHELAHRHRRTILNRVDQLLSDSASEPGP